MKYAVVGLGQFGYSAAVGLAARGREVIAVDIDMSRVESIKDDVSLAVCMDASQAKVMETHGLGEVDVLIAAIGGNFEAQVLLVVHAKQRGVKKIVARATTADHIGVLKAVGAHEVFNPEQEAARWAVQRILVPKLSNYFEMADGFSLVEIELPESLLGKTMIELDLRRRFRINLVAIKSRGPSGDATIFNPVPEPTQVFREGDVLALSGSVLDIANFLAHYDL